MSNRTVNFAKVPKASKSLKWANCLTSDFLLSTFNWDSMIMVEAITTIQTRMDQVPIVLKERTLTSSHMSMFANNALLGGGVRVRVWIREQRKITRRSKALLSL